MIVAAWYFTDETEGLMGPYVSEADASRSAELYGKWLLGEMTDEDGKEAHEIHGRSLGLAESIGLTHARSTYVVDRNGGLTSR